MAILPRLPALVCVWKLTRTEACCRNFDFTQMCDHEALFLERMVRPREAGAASGLQLTPQRTLC